MSDYIKREDAIYCVKSMLKAIQADDVAPVRHGRWLETSYDERRCSVCGKDVKDEIIFMLDIDDREHVLNGVANYCPNCGAKMDEEAK